MKRAFFNIIIPLFVILGSFYTISTFDFENWVVDRSYDIEKHEQEKKEQQELNKENLYEEIGEDPLADEENEEELNRSS